MSKSYPVSCSQCDWSGSYSSEQVAKRILRLHTTKKHTLVDKEPKAKRKYTKSKADKSINPLGLSFCPSCGLNLQLISRAIVMAGKM